MSGIDTGVEFNFSFAPGTKDEQILGFEVAGEVWSQYLKDVYQEEEIEINIYVAVGDDILPDDVVGGAFPAIETGIAYREVYNALRDDVNNETEIETDKTAFDSLLNVKKLPVLVGEDIVWKNPQIQATRANLKALDLLDGDPSELDGFIVMNSLVNAESVSWNYNYLEAPQEGEIDFLSVAIHELGHNLGFVSGVDIYGWNEQSADFNGTNIDHMSPLDLFRYSEESFEAKDGSYTMRINDLTFGRAAYFTIDGTINNAIPMSTGAVHQGSHWSNGNLETGMGIMNPTIRLGERWEISENDLTAFDVIGWDVDYNATVDLNELFSKAQANVDYTRLDRADEVNEILSGQAYEWAWRSSGASSSGYWWAWRSSGASSSGYWWAWRSSGASSSGYWSTYDSDTYDGNALNTGTSSNDNSDDYDPISLEDIGEDSVLDQDIGEDSVLYEDLNDDLAVSLDEVVTTQTYKTWKKK